MRASNIKYLIGLKKMGHNILFKNCPQCKRFFGTNEAGVETCSVDCDIKYALRDQYIEIERKNRINTLLRTKHLIGN